MIALPNIIRAVRRWLAEGDFLSVKTTTVYTDHIAEQTTAHTIIADHDVTLTATKSLLAAATTCHIGATGARMGNIFGTALYAVTHYADHIAENTGSHTITFDSSITVADAKDIIFNTTTGTKIGTGTTQKLGFWNATPIIQPASANQAAVSLDVDVTGSDTVDKAAINTNFTNIQTLLNQLRTDLVSAGLIKGSA